MNVNYKKCLKIVTLVITAVLIGSVSAATYSYMYIQGSGSITSGGLGWATGNDAPAGATVAGAYVTNMNFSIPVNSPRNFTDSLHLINADTSPHTFGIESTVTAGNASKFSEFDMVIYQSGGARVAKISIKSGESATGLTIQGSETLYIRFEINPLLDETSGYLAFTVKLTYEVA
jgi:hypothetical protein